MTQVETIVTREQYIRSILSVVQKHYYKGEFQNPLPADRKEDLFICVLDGEARYHFESETQLVQAGDVLFVPQGYHYERNVLTDHYHIILTYFHFDTPEGNSCTLSHSFFPATTGMDLEFFRLHKKWSSRGPGAQSESMSIFYSIYMRLIRSGISAYMPGTKKELFEASIHRLTTQYTDKQCSVSRLAAQAEMSEVHFRRCFKQIYHVSPQQYLLELRLTRARELLQYDTSTVVEISHAVGFSDPCYFSRLFKSKTGYTPSEYRTTYGTPHPD